MQSICLLVSIVAIGTFACAILHSEWTRATFDYDAIERRVNNSNIQFHRLNAPGETPMVLLWDRRIGAADECLVDDVPLAHNATLVMDESANVHQVCRTSWSLFLF